MTKKKDTYHHGDLRQAMLDAASEILSQEGLSALTLRACARRAGVSHAAPSHHFGSLKGLYTAIVAQCFVMIAEVAEQVIADSDGQSTNILADFARAYTHFAIKNPERFRLMFRRDLVDVCDPELERVERRTYTAFTQIVHMVRGEPVEDFQKFREGKLPTGIYKDVLLLWSTVHGFTHLYIEQQLVGYDEILSSDPDKFVDEIWDELSTAALGGLSTRLKSKA
jgi:AcrR family transcriptional regulator